MNNKLVYYIGNFERPEINAPGKRVYGNALILKELDYKVVLVGKSKNVKQYEEPIMYDDIPFLSFPSFGFLKPKKYIRYLDRLFKKYGEPSIVIRYGSPEMAVFDKNLLNYCKSRKIVIVSDVVDWLPAGEGNIVYKLIKRLDTYLEKVIYNSKSKGIIAISTYLDNYYKDKVSSTIVIPPIVDSYKENVIKNDVIQLIYAGVPFKLGAKVNDTKQIKDRLDLAIKVLGSIANRGKANFEFHIFGLTKEQYLIAFPDDRIYINKSIIFHGRQSMEEVQKKLNQSDFSILLREKNRATMSGFPTKVVESLSCGTPVITTKTSDLEEYITEGNNGFFVNIDNVKILEKQIYEILIKSKDDISSMKQNCYVNQQFLPKNYVEEMNVFLNSIYEKQ